mgnify:FL=1
MPQQLIRLTSSSGDGVFNGIFNQAITIKENSEIALQSLSVERRSQEIAINNTNGIVGFSSVSATGTPLDINQTGNVIPQQLYNKANSQELLDNIGNAMNRVCDLNTDDKQWGIQHQASVGTNGSVQIGARVSPFYQIQRVKNTIPDFVVDNRSVVNQVLNGEKLNVYTEFQGDGEKGMWRATDTTTQGANLNLNESYVFGTEPCIKSTGIFRTRFRRLIGAAGLPSFTMGLVKGGEGLAKLQTSTLTQADCVYALRVRGTANSIQYLREKEGDWIDSGIDPVNFTLQNAGDNLNDVLDISFQGGTVAGVISSETTGTPTRTVLDSAIGHDDTDDYYWFISLHEKQTECVLDLVGVTLDPWHNIGVGEPTSIRKNNIANVYFNGNSEITNLPQPRRAGSGASGDADPFTPSVQLSSILATYLGFKVDYLTDVNIIPPVRVKQRITPSGLTPVEAVITQQAMGYFFRATLGYDNSFDSDTYIIDTQTFTLDSFDSYGLSESDRNANSGGSRRNIVATIPITEVPIVGSPNSLIQFQPGTLLYVAIKNRGDIVTRQIRCKLLTGMYNDVVTEGLASIVLLIKEP